MRVKKMRRSAIKEFFGQFDSTNIKRRSRTDKELWLALFAILLIAAIYLIVVRWFKAVPAASGFFGHMIGVIGFLLMLSTETLYSFRKRLAGVTTLLTVIIVISGFIGRYIYTRIPRNLDGIEISTPEGQAQSTALARTRRLFATWHAIHIPIGLALFTAAFIHVGAALYYATLLH
jgi:hypothetical protein